MPGNSKTNFLITREQGLFCMAVVLAFTVFFFGWQPGLAQERVFFGNLHSHTSYSDGLGKPHDAFLYARDIAKLDFLALTEHNHAEALGSDGIGIATNLALYKGSGPNSLISSARAFTENDRFVALYGQEFSTISSGNHANVFDIGEVIGVPKGEFGLLLDFLNTNPDSSGQPAIMMFNHPKNSLGLVQKEYGLDDFTDIGSWITGMSKHVRLIQMINGPGMSTDVDATPAGPDENAYLKLLNLGFKIGPTADQDNHRKNWGNATTARTAVVMTSLTKSNLLEALRSRHVYATENKNLSIIIKVNNHLCGDVISPMPVPSELSVTYAISDTDEPDAEYEIQVWRDAIGGDVANMVSAVIVDAGNGTIEDVAFSGEPQFFFFKIIQRGETGGEDRVWTAPVWFENQAVTSGPLTISMDDGSDSAIASKKSEVYHVSDACLDAKRIKPANRITGAAARHGRTLHSGCPRISQDR